MSNRSLTAVLVLALAGLAAIAAYQISVDGAYAGLYIGVLLVPTVMVGSVLVALACGLRRP